MGLAKPGSFLQGHKQLPLGLQFLVFPKQACQVEVGLGGILRFQFQQGAPRLDRGFSLILGLGGQEQVAGGVAAEAGSPRELARRSVERLPSPQLLPQVR